MDGSRTCRLAAGRGLRSGGPTLTLGARWRNSEEGTLSQPVEAATQTATRSLVVRLTCFLHLPSIFSIGLYRGAAHPEAGPPSLSFWDFFFPTFYRPTGRSSRLPIGLGEEVEGDTRLGRRPAVSQEVHQCLIKLLPVAAESTAKKSFSPEERPQCSLLVFVKVAINAK